MPRYGRQISLSGTWKFRTDPDGMGDRYPDDAVAAYKEDCMFFDPGCDLPGTKAVLFRRPTRLTCGTLPRRTGTG